MTDFRRILVTTLAVAVAATPALAQDKVIKKTTDASGFERQLTEVDMQHQTANQLMTAGQWAEAAAELEKVVAKEADRLEAWQDLAKCYTELNQYDKASTSYEAAHKLNPEDTDLLSVLGYTQLRADKLDGAIATYNKMLTINPVSYDANVHLGFILHKQGDLEKAAGYYEKALEGKPDDVATMGSLARVYDELGRQSDALVMYEKSVGAATPEQKKEILNKLGKAQLDNKEFDKAAATYGQLVEISPDSPANQFNLAISLMQANRHAEAAGAFESTIKLKPDYAAAYQYLAQCQNEAGNYQGAITTVRKGLNSAPAAAGGLYCQWGRALEKMELYDEAIEKFQMATSDAQYGSYAQKQIQRQEDLKKRAKMMKGQ